MNMTQFVINRRNEIADKICRKSKGTISFQLAKTITFRRFPIQPIFKYLALAKQIEQHKITKETNDLYEYLFREISVYLATPLMKNIEFAEAYENKIIEALFGECQKEKKRMNGNERRIWKYH